MPLANVTHTDAQERAKMSILRFFLVEINASTKGVKMSKFGNTIRASAEKNRAGWKPQNWKPQNKNLITVWKPQNIENLRTKTSERIENLQKELKTSKQVTAPKIHNKPMRRYQQQAKGFGCQHEWGQSHRHSLEGPVSSSQQRKLAEVIRMTYRTHPSCSVPALATEATTEPENSVVP